MGAPIGVSTSRRWISCEDVARILGVSRARVNALVESGHLTKRSIPGTWPTFPLDEVERLAAEHTKEATAWRRPRE